MTNILDRFRLPEYGAIVTGGGSGLGRDIALGLAQAGANVAIGDLDGPLAEQAAAEIEGLGVKAIGRPTDVAEEAQVVALVEAAQHRFGRIDVLVNNAGIGRQLPTVELPLARWREVFAVNVEGMFLCCKHAGRLMLERRRGSIINIASVYGLVGIDHRLYPEVAGQPRESLAYAASKGAVVNLTRALATSWARHGVRVNAIAPGMMLTKRLQGLFDEQAQGPLRERTPLNRWGVGDDLQGAAVYLASEASSFVTGHVLVVDGGWVAW